MPVPGRALLLPVALLLLVACTPGHTSPLHDAAVNQDIVLLQQLLDSRKYDVNGLDASGRTPLAAALATCSNYTGRFPRMVPNGELQFCATGTADGISASLICAGADVNVDVFPKERPGYKLVHLAACSGANDLYYLLAGGTDANARYRLPDGRTVTPLTWAALCVAAGKNNTEYGYPGFSVERLLGAGADPLPFGPSATPPSALAYPKPHPLSRCNKLGACSAAEVQRIFDASWEGGAKFPEGFNIGYWRPLWEAQEAKAANPNTNPELADWFKRGKSYACKSADDYLKSELASRKETAEKQRYARAYPLHVAVAADNLTAVKAIMSSGKIDVNSKNDKGLTPLQAGMGCSKTDFWCWPQVGPDVAEFLVSKGANVRLDVYPGSGYTLLHKAAFHGLTRLVRALLKGGADPNAVYYAADDKQRNDPQTPLTRAAYCDFRRSTNDGTGPDSTNGTMQALLDAGAKLLPFGKERPMTSFFLTPQSAQKCVKIGACSEAQLQAVLPDFKSGSCPVSFELVWRLQEKQAAAAAGKPPQQQQQQQQQAAKQSGRRLRAVVV
ncbi:hypothetical protein OEZ86_008210 [Tetradesmus obliquus]|nr:hypothetical protein OEZ86_008210 [Tetradesmus obliquus]